MKVQLTVEVHTNEDSVMTSEHEADAIKSVIYRALAAQNYKGGLIDTFRVDISDRYLR